MFGEGISKIGEILDLGVKLGVVQKSGAWYSYKGERISQGRENAKQYLREHPDIAAEIDRTIRDTLMAEPETFEDGVIAAADEEK